MRIKKPTLGEILVVPRQVYVAVFQGIAIATVILQVGVTALNDRRRPRENGGLPLNLSKRITELECENAQRSQAPSNPIAGQVHTEGATRGNYQAPRSAGPAQLGSRPAPDDIANVLAG